MSGSIPSWCRVGAKVVCVDDRWGALLSGATRIPMINEVLTITGVNNDFIVGIQFAEIPTVILGSSFDYCVFWCASQFRPLVNRADEIEATIYRAKGRHHRLPAKADA